MMVWLGLALLFIVLALIGLGRRANRCDWGYWHINLVDGWLRIFCRYYHGLRAEALPLPTEGGALVVANHVSGLDPFLLVAASQRPLRFLIAVEEYQRFGLNWLFRGAGCIPVERDGRPEQSFRSALRILRRGEVVALFPHGRIHLESEPPEPIKPGVLRMAELGRAPIYPVRLTGIAGEGHVVRGVFKRSRAVLTAYTPFQADAAAEVDFSDRLCELLMGRRSPS